MLEMLKSRKEQLQAQGKKGFTLMEMLIVIAIIAILIAIAIPVFTSQLNNARHATDQSNARALYAQVQAEYMLNSTMADIQNMVDPAGKVVTFSNGTDTTKYTFEDTCTALELGTTAGGAPAIHLTSNGADDYFGATAAGDFTSTKSLIS